MSKIVQAINAMVSNPEKITDSVKGSNEMECFFEYDAKHHWSILKDEDNYYRLYYYPGQTDLSSLASIPDEGWVGDTPGLVEYNTKDLATKEAIDSFRELFSIVNEKIHGMNDVLNEIIISDDSRPF